LRIKNYQSNDFIKLLRQIMSREYNPILSQEKREQSIREMEVIELVGIGGWFALARGVQVGWFFLISSTTIYH